VPTRSQLLELVRAGRSYEEVGEHFGIPPGQAYMIVTGLPADGSTTIGPEFLRKAEGLLPGSSQHLSNPRTVVPQRDSAVAEWVKQRARQDRQMQEAAAARTAEPPPVEGEERSDDIVSVIGWDHNQIKYLLEELQAIPGTRQGGRPAQEDQRVSIVDMVRVRLSGHEKLEEEYFWPAVRSTLLDGDQLADQALRQEQEGKVLLQAMSGMSGSDEEFDEAVEQLVLMLRKHVAFEDIVLLQMRQSMAEAEREELGRRFMAGRSHAPTRPHPHAPDSPTTNRAAATMAAPVDKLRDAAGPRPATQKGRSAPSPTEPGEREGDEG
jgi:hemerythrin-like domain-containing protein